MMCKLTGKLLVLAALGTSLLGCAAQLPSTDGKIRQESRTAKTICGDVMRLQTNQADCQARGESLTASGGGRRIGTPAVDDRVAGAIPRQVALYSPSSRLLLLDGAAEIKQSSTPVPETAQLFSRRLSERVEPSQALGVHRRRSKIRCNGRDDQEAQCLLT
jgi:hypothetical protein